MRMMYMTQPHEMTESSQSLRIYNTQFLVTQPDGLSMDNTWLSYPWPKLKNDNESKISKKCFVMGDT